MAQTTMSVTSMVVKENFHNGQSYKQYTIYLFNGCGGKGNMVYENTQNFLIFYVLGLCCPVWWPVAVEHLKCE